MSSQPQATRRVLYSPFPARPVSMFLTLPSEILVHTLALLVGQTPLGPPAALIPVMLTCKALHKYATCPELLARICRFKLDVAAVERRIITPWNVNLKEHLIYCCRLMRALRRGLPARDTEGNDVPRTQQPAEGNGPSSTSTLYVEVDNDPEEIRDWDPSQVLFACLMVLLDNDGKNIAQLEWAGVHAYVRQFLLERLWDGSYLNDGWPLENHKNASALWVMWLITDQEMLKEETPANREALIERIFPFVYPSSEAPPNHFHLPLSNASTTHIPQQVPIQFPIASRHAEAYREPPLFPTPEDMQEAQSYRPQMYPHYSPSRGFVVPYFGASPLLGAPPSSMAAKLLYVSRREVHGISPPPPPHVPATRATAPPGWRGPTGEDYLALNAAKGALTPKRRRWDWNKGYCRAVSKQQVEGPSPGDGSSKKHDESIFDEKGDGDGGDDDDADEENRRRKENDMDDSRKWDTLWWRMRLCNNLYSPKPRFEAGLVFDPGCMRGSWRGKIYIPSGVPFRTLLNTAPIYPGVPDDTGRFSEYSIGLIMQHIFLDIQEHHRVCMGASYYRSDVRGRSRRPDEHDENAASIQRTTSDTCGTVPVPRPAHRDWTQFAYAEPFLHQLGVSSQEEQGDLDQEVPGGATAHAASLSSGRSSAGSTDGSGATVVDANRRGRRRRNNLRPASTALDRALHVALAGAPSAAEPQPVDEQMMLNPLRVHNVTYVDHVNPEDRDTQDNDASTDPSNASNRAVRGHDWQPQNRIDHIDMSMTNAWFPGVLGSLQWTKRDGGYVDSLFEAVAQGRPVRKWRDDLLVSVSQNPDMNAPKGCVHDHGGDLQGTQPEQNGPGQTWVYETYDPERVGAHEYHTSIAPSTGSAHAPVACKRCAERDAKLKEIREQEATQQNRREWKEHRRHLEHDESRRARADARREEHSAAIGMLDELMRSFGGQIAEEDAQMEDLDTEGGIFGFGEPEDSETEDEDDESDDQMSVLGDDFDGYDSDVEGRQSDTAHMRAEYYENLRRGYSPSRIMRPSTTNATTSHVVPTSPAMSTTTAGASACPSATGDTIITGGTPESASMWGRRYAVYGRVRPWDGLVGMLRVGQNMVSTDYMFIFGYVVGGVTFVGEWRLASSDVMRPTLGSAIVMSRYDQE